jgi:hypothetical protein
MQELNHCLYKQNDGVKFPMLRILYASSSIGNVNYDSHEGFFVDLQVSY